MSDAIKAWWGTRPLYEFDIPAALQEVAGGKAVGLVQLQVEDEVRITDLAEGNRSKLLMLQLRYTVATLDGRVLGKDSPEVEALIRSDQKVRNLLIAAYGTIAMPSDTEVNGFLASMRVR